MGADDRTNGEGWRTQNRKVWLPEQMRTEKISGDAVTIDGRKEWFCKFLFGNKCVDEVEMPQVLYEHPFRVAREVDRDVSAKAGVCSSGSMSSSGGCCKDAEKKARNPARKRQVVKVGTRKFGRWKLTKSLTARSWISETKSCKNSCVKLRDSQMYRKVRKIYSKKGGSNNGKILSTGGMIS